MDKTLVYTYVNGKFTKLNLCPGMIFKTLPLKEKGKEYNHWTPEFTGSLFKVCEIDFNRVFNPVKIEVIFAANKMFSAGQIFFTKMEAYQYCSLETDNIQLGIL